MYLLRRGGRQRKDDDDDDDKMTNEDGRGKDNVQINANNDEEVDEEARIVAERRQRYDDIMAKSKARSDKAFKTESNNAMLPSSLNNDDDDDDGDDDDDAFLNAALAKARRLQRLRELNGSVGGMPNTLVKVEGEDAVIHAVEQMKRKEEEDAAAAATLMDGGDLETDVMTNKSDRITFEVDEIQEFTRALRSRDNENQSSSRRGNSIDGGIITGGKDGEGERRGGGKLPSRVLTVPGANNIVATSTTLQAESDIVESTNMKTDDDEDDDDDNADMEEMARDMEVDDASNIDDDHNTSSMDMAVRRRIKNVD